MIAEADKTAVDRQTMEKKILKEQNQRKFAEHLQEQIKLKHESIRKKNEEMLLDLIIMKKSLQEYEISEQERKEKALEKVSISLFNWRFINIIINDALMMNRIKN